MTLAELIEEYKLMASNCHNIDYSNKKAVALNNKSVTRMYQIVDKINTEFGSNGVIEFSKLIYIKNDKVDLWASIQLLEKMSIDLNIQKLALAIIEEEAKASLGLKYWLKNYQDKKYSK